MKVSNMSKQRERQCASFGQVYIKRFYFLRLLGFSLLFSFISFPYLSFFHFFPFLLETCVEDFAVIIKDN